MNHVDIDLVKNDFNDLCSYLKQKHFKPNGWNSEDVSRLQKVHSSIYSLSLWNHNLTSANKLFLAEAVSDAVTSIPLALLGLKKHTELCIRELLEDILRYIYFCNHPIEYEWLSKGKFNISWKELLDYLYNIIYYDNKSILAKKMKDELTKLYKETSKYIHAHSEHYTQMTTFLDKIEWDRVFFKYYNKQICSAISWCNAILLYCWYDDFNKFHHLYKKIIKKNIARSTLNMVLEP